MEHEKKIKKAEKDICLPKLISEIYLSELKGLYVSDVTERNHRTKVIFSC